jgi:putative hydrolase of the HAD superfamily
MRAILFDFGGTLDYPLHWLDRFLGHYRAAGLWLERAELDPAYDYATQEGYRASETVRGWGLRRLVGFLVGLQLEYLADLSAEAVRKQVGALAKGGRQRLTTQISEAFVTESEEGLCQSKKILLALADRFRLGVVSNFYGNLDRVLEEAGLLDLMGAVVDSSRVGIFKPDPRIFRRALDALGIRAPVEPGSAAMVGDSLAKDLAPARQLGLTTIWLFPRARGGNPDSGGLADHTIGVLAELGELSW